LNQGYSASTYVRTFVIVSPQQPIVVELIAHRYERHSLIIILNQSFEDWDELFTDTTMTVAAIDRLVHHAHVIQLIGESYRRRTAMKEDK
jgi:DNA replication protein DnaC